MKIISLNCWAGKRFDELMRFIESENESTDVFCFQEIFDTASGATILEDGSRANLYSEIKRRLPQHRGLLSVHIEGLTPQGPVDYDFRTGLAFFIKPEFEVLHERRYLVHGVEGVYEGGIPGQHPRIAHAVTVKDGSGRQITIVNVHALWKKGFGKGDCPERLLQSERLREVMANYPDPKILIGDFNLMPDTKSFTMLKAGMRDLISEYGITSTRSDLYNKPEVPFADYALLSPDIEVESFEVPRVNVSDHLPLILKVNI